MNNSARTYTLIAGLMLLVCMEVFTIYSNKVKDISFYGITFNKNRDLLLQKESRTNKPVPIRKDTVKIPAKSIDSSAKKFLLVGDSQVEGLKDPFYDYCKKNGHELALALIWYSATDVTFASNDTLKKIIQKYKPDHIVFAIGLNQIFQTYFDVSEKAIGKIIETFGDIPYSWIGPANWMPDKGINRLYEEKIDPQCYFQSKGLVLDRAKDGRHPSYKGNFIWMDSIATWMQNRSKWNIRMEKPDSAGKNRPINMFLLNATAESKKGP